MRRIKDPAIMQRLALRWRSRGVRIGFVPTMGYLHAGHLSLVARARQAVGSRGRVVVSIYVNPTQFGPAEDLSRYPRDPKRDLALCRDAGTDVVFMPEDATMYSGRETGRYSTYVVEESLTRSMEGVTRPTHFRGVTTIVAKLFNLVQPNVAVFGEKDWQQATVVGRMVQDLNIPLQLVVAPTVREPDGLAMSSRNKYLDPVRRAQAVVLWRSLNHVRSRVGSSRSGRVSSAVLTREVASMISKEPDARMDYVEFFEPSTLAPQPWVMRGTRMALAVLVGPTRLIDNGLI
ncbi:MAG: pantoate--beta-alanine ligase [Verrucomicrobiales bacterium]|nr:pantoate--beta-alanine ligase [Verrucomicrobiales bacterium]